MTTARIGGGAVALVLIALLALVGSKWWVSQPLVLPSIHWSVTDQAGDAWYTDKYHKQSVSAEEVLKARTELQMDRNQAKEQGFPARSAGNQNLLPQAPVDHAFGVVDGWLRNRVEDSMILQPQAEIFGQTTVPYKELNVVSQPQGRIWRADHDGPIRFGGASLIFGVSLALALFLFARGRIKIAEGESGATVLRFDALERANHWMTATAFVIMGLTGLVILYGKPLLLPLVGQYALSQVAHWSAWLHMASAVPFVLGIALMAVLWLKENVPTGLDMEWLRRGGGLFSDSPDKPPARRFNAGQKLVFWGVELGGVVALVSGLMLMYPYYVLGYDGMQWAQLLHATIGLLMIALIIGHIYIGTVGMEGAIDAMWKGRVDRNWAREHHELWLRDIESDSRAVPSPMKESPP